MSDTPSQPAGWYYAQGDPPGTQRYWDGTQWQGGPQPVGAPAGGAAAGGAMPGGAMPGGAVPGAYGMAAEAAPVDGGQRILARLVDVVIWIIISIIFAGVIGGGNAVSFGSQGSARAAIAGLVGGLVIVAYEVYMVANGGQTIGKKALGIKVVTEDGGAPDMNVALKRMSIYLAGAVLGIIPIISILSGLAVFVVGIVSLVFIFTDAKKQAIWDKVAGTIVVKA